MPFLRVNSETGQYEYNYRFDWPAAVEEEPVVDPPVCVQSLSHVLRDAYAKLMELREGKHDADGLARFSHTISLCEQAGLVVCVDIGHSQNVARWLREVTGETVVIAAF